VSGKVGAAIVKSYIRVIGVVILACVPFIRRTAPLVVFVSMLLACFACGFTHLYGSKSDRYNVFYKSLDIGQEQGGLL